MERTTSGRVTLRISLQPSCPSKSSSVSWAACSMVPMAPSATTTRSARTASSEWEGDTTQDYRSVRQEDPQDQVDAVVPLRTALILGGGIAARDDRGSGAHGRQNRRETKPGLARVNRRPGKKPSGVRQTLRLK